MAFAKRAGDVHVRMASTYVLGLTGGIAAGKSTLVAMLRRRNVAVWEADRVVEALYAPGGGASRAVRQVCPEAVDEQERVDRDVLADVLRRHPEKLAELEAAVHPLVARARDAYVEERRKEHVPLVVVDVPLLYETGGEKNVDGVLLAHAERHVRETRALERPGMTREKLDMILARQWNDEAKLQRADYVIDTSGDLADVEAQLDQLLDHLQTTRGPTTQNKTEKESQPEET